MTEEVVLPLDQRYAVPNVEVRMTEPPEQKVVLPIGVMIAEEELTVTVVAAEVAEQPAAFVTLTV